MLENGAKSSEIVQDGNNKGLNIGGNSLIDASLQTQLQNA